MDKERIMDAFDGVEQALDELRAAITKPEQPKRAKHWIGPFQWPGGERSPFPKGTKVRLWENGYIIDESTANWAKELNVWYCADNAEGWINLPGGWDWPGETHKVAHIQTKHGNGSWVQFVPRKVKPERFWIGPFEWRGGDRSPLPPRTKVRLWADGCIFDESVVNWSSPTLVFWYAADNADGWIERPKGWSPPTEAYPLEVCTKLGGRTELHEERPWCWSTAAQTTTAIRLMPRGLRRSQFSARSRSCL